MNFSGSLLPTSFALANGGRVLPWMETKPTRGLLFMLSSICHLLSSVFFVGAWPAWPRHSQLASGVLGNLNPDSIAAVVPQADFEKHRQEREKIGAFGVLAAEVFTLVRNPARGSKECSNGVSDEYNFKQLLVALCAH